MKIVKLLVLLSLGFNAYALFDRVGSAIDDTLQGAVDVADDAVRLRPDEVVYDAGQTTADVGYNIFGEEPGARRQERLYQDGYQNENWPSQTVETKTVTTNPAGDVVTKKTVTTYE